MTHDPSPDGARDEDGTEPGAEMTEAAPAAETTQTQEAENDVTETTQTIEDETTADTTVDAPDTEAVAATPEVDATEEGVLADQVATGACDFGVPSARVSVLSAGGGFSVRISGHNEKDAGVILKHAELLPR